MGVATCIFEADTEGRDAKMLKPPGADTPNSLRRAVSLNDSETMAEHLKKLREERKLERERMDKEAAELELR